MEVILKTLSASSKIDSRSINWRLLGGPFQFEILSFPDSYTLASKTATVVPI